MSRLLGWTRSRPGNLFASTRDIRRALADSGYQSSDATTLAIRMADLAGRPLLVEGATGVGKTELARAVAAAAGARLVRLQCFDGIGEAQTLYEWNHCKQILRLQSRGDATGVDVFSAEYLLERPVLTALRSSVPTVLLIDEIDKATVEFDALLLEVLSDFTVSIGELGTVLAARRPFVVLTSGGTRELSDALRRRCHFVHLPSPSPAMERRILDRAVPGADVRLRERVQSVPDGGWGAVLRSIDAAAVGHIVGFVDALRDSGIPAGASALVDAVRAVGSIDLADRDQVREALCCTLVHRAVELPTFVALFDLWFPPGLVARPPAERSVAEVLTDLDPATADTELRELAADLVERFGGYESRDGASFSALQVSRTVDLDATANAVALALGSGASTSPMQSAVAQRTARERVEALRRAVVADTTARVAARRSKEQVAQYAVPRTGLAKRGTKTDSTELIAVRRAVVELGRILAAREASARRRARAGEIDLRRTMRKSMSTSGVPIELMRRKPRIAKPELVLLCDMSSSVSEFTYFTLMLVDALRSAFSRVRIFVFVDSVDEVTDLFVVGGDLDSAVAKIGSTADVGLGQRTDYGNALAGFAAGYPDAVTSRSSLLVIGDARSNYADSRADVLDRLVATAKVAHWLNPEPRDRWGTGDSAAYRYGEYIAMHECRNARQLSAVVAALVS